MAIYRDRGPVGPYRSLIVVAGAALLLLLALNPLLRTYQTLVNPPTPAMQPTSKLFDMLSQSLDLFDIEYAKVRNGASPATTGAPDAIARAISAADTLAEDFAFSNQPALATLRTALAQMRDAIGKRPPPALGATLTNAENALAQLRLSTQPTPGRP
jgi:hypothetical protein